MKVYYKPFCSSIVWVRSSNQYIPALTGLRAVAAYLVFLHHYNPAPPGTVAHALFEQGYVGVSIFFVLSGFVIYHRYAPSYLTKLTWSWHRYLWRRFVRIYPLYGLLFLLTAGIQAVLHQPMGIGLFWLNSSLLKGFTERFKFSGIAQSWSLTVELCFYVLAPLLFVGLHRWGAARLTIGLVGIGLVEWVIAGADFTTESVSFILFYTFFGRSFEFVMGMALARRWQGGSLPFMPSATGVGLVILTICVCWQAYLIVYIRQPFYLIGSEVVAYNWILPIGISLLLMGLIQGKTAVGWLLTQPLLLTAGRSSYAFYLIHVGIIANGLQRVGLTNQWVLFGSLISIAYASHHFIERKLLHCLGKTNIKTLLSKLIKSFKL